MQYDKNHKRNFYKIPIFIIKIFEYYAINFKAITRFSHMSEAFREVAISYSERAIIGIYSSIDKFFPYKKHIRPTLEKNDSFFYNNIFRTRWLCWYVLNKGPDYIRDSVIDYVIFLGYVSILNELITGWNLRIEIVNNDINGSLFDLAIQSGSIEMVEYFIDLGQNPKARSKKSSEYNAVTAAIKSRSLSMYEYVISLEVPFIDNTITMNAVLNNKHKIIIMDLLDGIVTVEEKYKYIKQHVLHNYNGREEYSSHDTDNYIETFVEIIETCEIPDDYILNEFHINKINNIVFIKILLKVLILREIELVNRFNIANLKIVSLLTSIGKETAHVINIKGIVLSIQSMYNFIKNIKTDTGITQTEWNFLHPYKNYDISFIDILSVYYDSSKSDIIMFFDIIGLHNSDFEKFMYGIEIRDVVFTDALQLLLLRNIKIVYSYSVRFVNNTDDAELLKLLKTCKIETFNSKIDYDTINSNSIVNIFHQFKNGYPLESTIYFLKNIDFFRYNIGINGEHGYNHFVHRTKRSIIEKLKPYLIMAGIPLKNPKD